MNRLLLITVVGALMAGAYIYQMQPKQQLTSTSYSPEVLAAWEQWKAIHRNGEKLYGTLEEDNYRLAIFSDNYNEIQVSNANPKHTFKLGLNQFSDMTSSEFEKIYLNAQTDVEAPQGYPEQPEEPRNGNVTEVNVDWVSAGRVTRIKDQGQCGSCWAFGTTGALEALYAKQNGKQQEFSEQQLVDCWHGSLLPPRLPCMGCSGGNPGSALGGVSSTGIMKEEDYQYTAKAGTCKFDSSKVAFKNKSYSNVTPLCNSCLRTAVDGQPVAVAIYATPIQHYTNGIYNGSCMGRPNHAVLVVGYGTENGQAYWKIKNSWSTRFGEQGYFRIPRTDSIGLGACWIAMQAKYPY